MNFIVMVCFMKYVILCNSGIESWLHGFQSNPEKKKIEDLPVFTSNLIGIDVSALFGIVIMVIFVMI